MKTNKDIFPCIMIQENFLTFIKEIQNAWRFVDIPTNNIYQKRLWGSGEEECRYMLTGIPVVTSTYWHLSASKGRSVELPGLPWWLTPLTLSSVPIFRDLEFKGRPHSLAHHKGAEAQTCVCLRCLLSFAGFLLHPEDAENTQKIFPKFPFDFFPPFSFPGTKKKSSQSYFF